jgi:ectoine hydroxylase-related dioxygenase (phytanoyl-CoA dioxygenase family)
MLEDGYLYLPGLLERDQVLDVQRLVTGRLAAGGDRQSSHELARDNAPLAGLLYTGRMVAMFEKLLDGPIKHFDYTWFRAVPGGGQGTYPHCDIVYMGRGTFNLFTAWTPIGDIPLEVGGLMVLEYSHRQVATLANYLQRDVDVYCTNRQDAPDIESGAKTWQDWDGRLSGDPVSLRAKLGGRWLSADYQAGDVLVFGMATVHASLDNRSDRFRLSSDSRYQLASEPADERWIGANPVGHGPAGKRGKIC